jgi:hypothetical protein
MYKVRFPDGDEPKLKKDGKPYADGRKEKAYVLTSMPDCAKPSLLSANAGQRHVYSGTGLRKILRQATVGMPDESFIGLSAGVGTRLSSRRG